MLYSPVLFNPTFAIISICAQSQDDSEHRTSRNLNSKLNQNEMTEISAHSSIHDLPVPILLLMIHVYDQPWRPFST